MGKKEAKAAIFIALMILAAAGAAAEKYFVLDVNYIMGSVTFNSITLRELDRAVKYSDESGFLVKTLSFGNSEIKTFYYNMSENRNYIIYVPYDKNAARIEIYNPASSKVMDIGIESFADTCGNGVCEPYESYESCPKDCKSGSNDGFCDGVKDGICDPDCSPNTDVDCMQEKASNQTGASKPEIRQMEGAGLTEETGAKPDYLVWILSLFGIAIMVLAIILVKKIKEKRIIDSLKEYIGENIRKGFTLQQIKDALFREGYKEKEIDKAVKGI